MASARSTKDLMNMIRSNKNYEMEDNYGHEEYDKFPSVEADPKITYTESLKARASLRASTGHLRNMSQQNMKPTDSVEFPSIKHAIRENVTTLDLEQKLKKLKNLSQNDKEMIDIQRKKLAQQKFEIEKLLKKIEALKRNYDGLSNSSISEKNDFIRLKRENEQYAIEVEKLRNDNSSFKIREEQYKEELSNLYDLNKQMEERIGSLNHESKVRAEEIKKMKKHYDEKIKDLSTTNKELRESYQSYRDNIAKKDDEINRLSDQVRQLTSEVDTFKGSGAGLLNEIRGENDTLRSDIQALKLQLQRIQDEHDEKLRSVMREKEEAVKQANSMASKDELNKVQKHNSELQNKLDAADNEVGILSKDIEGLVKDLQDAKNQISEKNRSLSEKEDLVISLRKQIEELKAKLDEQKNGLSQKNSAAESKLIIMTEERSKLESEMNQFKKHSQSLEHKLKEKNDAYNDLEKSMKNKLEILQNEIAKAKKDMQTEITTLKGDLDKAKKSITDLIRERSNLSNENEDLKAQNSAFEKKLNSYSAFKDTVSALFKKILKHYEPVASNLSCLSCLEFLEDPLMLI